MNSLFNAIGKSILTVLMLILIIFGWVFFETKIMLKSNPEFFGYIFYNQTNNEMQPDINIDDVIIVKKNAEYKAGNIIFYISDKSEYKVRAAMYVDNIYTTVKCESCTEDAVQIDNGSVIGKVVGKLSYFGRIVKFFKQKLFLISLAVFGIIFIVISQYIHERPKQVKAETN